MACDLLGLILGRLHEPHVQTAAAVDHDAGAEGKEDAGRHREKHEQDGDELQDPAQHAFHSRFGASSEGKTSVSEGKMLFFPLKSMYR